MAPLYVCDTNSIIRYYNLIFNQNNKLSKKAFNIINIAVKTDSQVNLSIPSIVFVELFEKWCITEEMSRKIRYEIFLPIKEKPNIEIREFDNETLRNFISLDDNIIKLENHDKIILSSAITLNCPLITTDSEIIKYVSVAKVIPKVIS